MARQIEPNIYIDGKIREIIQLKFLDDEELISELSRFVPSLGMISHSETKTFPKLYNAKNIIVSPTLKTLFDTIKLTFV